MNPITSKPTYLNYRGTPSTTGVPSGVRTASPASSASAPMLNRLPSSNSNIPTNPTGNSIILYVPNVASPALSQHLSVLLSTHRIAAVHLIGRRDVVLKNLRTELYTLAGRMRSDVQVSISLTEGAKGLETALRDIGARRQKVLGALVCEWDELPEEEEQEKDVLTIDTDEIEAIWKVYRHIFSISGGTTTNQLTYENRHRCSLYTLCSATFSHSSPAQPQRRHHTPRPCHSSTSTPPPTSQPSQPPPAPPSCPRSLPLPPPKTSPLALPVNTSCRPPSCQILKA